MRNLWKKMISLLAYVKFWKKGNNMPGVSEQIRRTQLKQDQKRRRADMEELARMVKENRLHEADERQLESLKLVAELQKVFGGEAPPVGVPQELVDALTTAVTDAVTNLPPGAVAGPARPQDDPDRPTMGHVSLDLSQDGTDLEISHGDELGKEKESTDDAEDKRKKLRELKGKK
ncbi:unnamed protein product [marine sediment metagenome]|uniref:Uncharacterized protein n=1 Tax=marine sediment metagenome TaxID=412755 RepID=X0TVW1_9ZZZZ